MELNFNMTKNEKLVDAVRTVGQLLLHRPTSGVMARDNYLNEVSFRSSEACRFCYVGACNVVNACFFGAHYKDTSYKIGKDTVFGNKVSGACDKALGMCVDGDSWDSASPKQRKLWATKLANFKG